MCRRIKISWDWVTWVKLIQFKYSLMFSISIIFMGNKLVLFLVFLFCLKTLII